MIGISNTFSVKKFYQIPFRRNQEKVVNGVRETVESINQQIKQIDDKISQAQSKKERFQGEVNKKTNEIAKLKIEINGKKEEMNTLTGNIKEKTSIIGQLHEKKKMATQKVINIKSQLDTLKNSNKEGVNDTKIQQLTASYQKTLGELQSINQTIMKITNEKNQLEKKKQELQKEQTELSEELELYEIQKKAHEENRAIQEATITELENKKVKLLQSVTTQENSSQTQGEQLKDVENIQSSNTGRLEEDLRVGSQIIDDVLKKNNITTTNSTSDLDKAKIPYKQPKDENNGVEQNQGKIDALDGNSSKEGTSNIDTNTSMDDLLGTKDGKRALAAAWYNKNNPDKPLKTIDDISDFQVATITNAMVSMLKKDLSEDDIRKLLGSGSAGQREKKQYPEDSNIMSHLQNSDGKYQSDIGALVNMAQSVQGDTFRIPYRIGLISQKAKNDTSLLGTIDTKNDTSLLGTIDTKNDTSLLGTIDTKSVPLYTPLSSTPLFRNAQNNTQSHSSPWKWQAPTLKVDFSVGKNVDKLGHLNNTKKTDSGEKQQSPLQWGLTGKKIGNNSRLRFDFSQSRNSVSNSFRINQQTSAALTHALASGERIPLIFPSIGSRNDSNIIYLSYIGSDSGTQQMKVDVFGNEFIFPVNKSNPQYRDMFLEMAAHPFLSRMIQHDPINSMKYFEEKFREKYPTEPLGSNPEHFYGVIFNEMHRLTNNQDLNVNSPESVRDLMKKTENPTYFNELQLDLTKNKIIDNSGNITASSMNIANMLHKEEHQNPQEKKSDTPQSSPNTNI